MRRDDTSVTKNPGTAYCNLAMRQRLPLWIGLVAGLFAVQLGWWGLALWRQGDTVFQNSYSALQDRRGLAQQELAWRSTEGGKDMAEVWLELANNFEGVVWVPAANELQLSASKIESLEKRRSINRVMVIGEGTLFAMLWGVALWFLIKTSQRDKHLVLQESNFLHAVTHEFRSPLQSLRLAVESLQRRPDPTRAKEYAKMMIEDIGRLESLVDNVLLVGRIDARAFNPQVNVIDIGECLQQSLDKWRTYHPEQAELVRANIPAGMLAEADSASLDPIFHNLLDNASKYGEGSSIDVELVESSGTTSLRISDQGRGFTSAEGARLFDRFWRAGDERVRTSSGVGLGLYLVATLVHAQGATVNAQSDGHGQGATFIISWASTAAS
jgi:signal transduction histidine kinase